MGFRGDINVLRRTGSTDEFPHVIQLRSSLLVIRPQKAFSFYNVEFLNIRSVK